MWGRISPDLMIGWPDPQTKERRPLVFTALALLGATPPAISTLQDLSDWIDGQSVVKPSGAEMALSLALSDVVSVVECGASGAVVPGQDEGQPSTKPGTGTEGGVIVTPEMKAEIMTMIEAAIAKALGSADGGETAAMAEQKKELAALRGEMYTDRLTRAATEGKIKPAEVPALAAGLIEMSHATATATLAAVEARDGKTQPVGAVGHQTQDPLAGVTGEAKLIALAQAKGGSFAEAFADVCKANPSDYDEYRASTFKVRSGGDA
jgi:hypothetical protein